ncbi:hypothetical protein K1719_033019 [Acacia pycnantha]|nr:hypothetical protein K1719_033019 [Acacia pycnantha]
MLTNRGIEANPDKCRAVMEMKAPSNKKEVQQLTGRLAALTRFLPKSAENALPMFRLLKKEASVEWNSKCDSAFEEIKQCLANPPSSPNLYLVRASTFICPLARRPRRGPGKRGGARTNPKYILS